MCKNATADREEIFIRIVCVRGPCLGVEIAQGKLVRLSDEHQRCVNTDPTQTRHHLRLQFGSHERLLVTYIFARNTGPSNRDAAALIRALKGLSGYRVARSDVTTLTRRALLMAEPLLRDRKFDAVVPMPSTSSIVARLCRLLSVRMPQHPPILPILRKRTNGEVSALLPNPEAIPVALRDDYLRMIGKIRLQSPQSPVAMKHIPVRLRQFIEHIALDTKSQEIDGKRLLLVDDIISTGASFSPRARSNQKRQRANLHRRLRTLRTGRARPTGKSPPAMLLQLPSHHLNSTLI